MYLECVPQNKSRHTRECVAMSCSVLQGVLHVVLEEDTLGVFRLGRVKSLETLGTIVGL